MRIFHVQNTYELFLFIKKNRNTVKQAQKWPELLSNGIAWLDFYAFKAPQCKWKCNSFFVVGHVYIQKQSIKNHVIDAICIYIRPLSHSLSALYHIRMLCTTYSSLCAPLRLAVIVLLIFCFVKFCTFSPHLVYNFAGVYFFAIIVTLFIYSTFQAEYCLNYMLFKSNTFLEFNEFI